MLNLDNNSNKSTNSFIADYWIKNKISDCSKNVRTSGNKSNTKISNTKTSKKK